VEHLASSVVRRAGSVNEGRTIEYVSHQLQEAGLEVRVGDYQDLPESGIQDFTLHGGGSARRYNSA